MSKMWKEEEGYITVEASLIVSAGLMVLFLFMGYVCYFMDCGIAQGIMEETGLKAVDTVVTGGDYETGKIDYRKLNNRNLYTKMYPGKTDAAGKVKKDLRNSLRQHLFLGTVENVSVNTTADKVKVQVKFQLAVSGSSFLKMFKIKFFEYQGTYEASYLSEMEKIRRWNRVDETMD